VLDDLCTKDRVVINNPTFRAHDVLATDGVICLAMKKASSSKFLDDDFKKESKF